jgi:hypothetical protein
MGTKRRSQRKPGPDRRDVNERVNDAVTDLSAYALRMDAEWRRLDDRVLELAGQESSMAERRAVVRERAEIEEELSAFRGIIRALARAATPDAGEGGSLGDAGAGIGASGTPAEVALNALAHDSTAVRDRSGCERGWLHDPIDQGAPGDR